jgi:prevent-host-death family protein
MTTIGSYEAKTHLPRLLKQVSRGEEILITRCGVPVALLTSPNKTAAGSLEKIVQSMLQFRDARRKTIGRMTIRALREAGRTY